MADEDNFDNAPLNFDNPEEHGSDNEESSEETTTRYSSSKKLSEKAKRQLQARKKWEELRDNAEFDRVNNYLYDYHFAEDEPQLKK